MLAARLSPRKAARQLGWSHGMAKHIVPTTVMAIYCFLRFPTSFQRAVKSALLLAGHNGALVATVGGLVGAHVGVQVTSATARPLGRLATQSRLD